MDAGTRQATQRLPGCWTEARVSREGAMALTPPPGLRAGAQGAAGQRLGAVGLNRTPSGSSPISQQKRAG